MKVKDVIEMLSETRPHMYTDEVIFRWLSDVEGRIHNYVFKKEEPFEPIKAIEDNERQLLVYEPFTNVYLYYLYAMIEFANGETVKMANANAMFNSAYNEFVCDYMKKNEQKAISCKNIWW